uniref:Uncharacterized protein n=1 Tax=Rhizophora mucronata TaxID=61149 RepID=A0A2P2NKU5_RHIMU
MHCHVNIHTTEVKHPTEGLCNPVSHVKVYQTFECITSLGKQFNCNKRLNDQLIYDEHKFK